MHKYYLLFAFIFLHVNSYGQQKNTKTAAVVFTVNKAPTSVDEFIYLYKKNHQNKPEDFTEQKVNEYLALFINFKLKVAEARALGMDTTVKFIKELDSYKEDLKKPYRAEPDVLDKLTKEAYERLTKEVRASHLLIGLKPEATPTDTLLAFQKITALKRRIEAGEDFEKLARELSEDPTAKYNGGDLGYFTAMQMVYPFEEAAYKTPPGQLSNIVRTQFGYHVLKAIDIKPARGEVEVSHILFRTTSPDDAKVKNKTFEVADQLKAGRPWDDLCKEFSEDANTKNTGGRLRAFGIGALASVPEFESTAFRLQKLGEVSDPFQSAIGWHIVRLEKKIPLPAFAELEPSLKRKIARDERLQISQKTLAAKKRKEFALQEFDEAKKEIFKLADSSLIAGKWKNTLSREVRAKNVFSLAKMNFSVDDFATYILKNQAPSTVAPIAYMEQLYLSYIDQAINKMEEEKLLAEKPEFKNLLTEYREGILFFEIMEKKIWNKASEDTVGQQQYFESHLQAFKAGDRVEARIFTATEKSTIVEFKKKIEQGDSIQSDDLKKFKSVQPFRKYEKGESKVVDNVSWVSGLHELALDNNYYLVEIAQLVAPGTKTFAEARASIITGFQSELETGWLQALRKKYAISINKKGKQAVLTALVKK
jgi:peptidyl-prolyl cis-trans isomerase SurA